MLNSPPHPRFLIFISSLIFIYLLFPSQNSHRDKTIETCESHVNSSSMFAQEATTTMSKGRERAVWAGCVGLLSVGVPDACETTPETEKMLPRNKILRYKDLRDLRSKILRASRI